MERKADYFCTRFSAMKTFFEAKGKRGKMRFLRRDLSLEKKTSESFGKMKDLDVLLPPQ